MVNAFGQRRNRVIWLACLLEVSEQLPEQLTQPSALATLPREPIPIQHTLSFHCLPVPLARTSHKEREPEPYAPERCLRQVRDVEAPLDERDRAIRVVQEPGDERPQALGLLLVRTEICLADDQFPTDPVQVPLRVGRGLVCLWPALWRREMEERDRCLELPEWWLCEAGQAAAVEVIGLLEQCAEVTFRVRTRQREQPIRRLATVAPEEDEMREDREARRDDGQLAGPAVERLWWNGGERGGDREPGELEQGDQQQGRHDPDEQHAHPSPGLIRSLVLDALLQQTERDAHQEQHAADIQQQTAVQQRSEVLQEPPEQGCEEHASTQPEQHTAQVCQQQRDQESVRSRRATKRFRRGERPRVLAVCWCCIRCSAPFSLLGHIIPVDACCRRRMCLGGRCGWYRLRFLLQERRRLRGLGRVRCKDALNRGLLRRWTLAALFWLSWLWCFRCSRCFHMRRWSVFCRRRFSGCGLAFGLRHHQVGGREHAPWLHARSRIEPFVEECQYRGQREQEERACNQGMPVEWREGEIAGKVRMPEGLCSGDERGNEPGMSNTQYRNGDEERDEPASLLGPHPDAGPAVTPGPGVSSPEPQGVGRNGQQGSDNQQQRTGE